MLYLAGVVRHSDDYIASVSLEGEPGYMFRLVTAIVVAGSVVRLLVGGHHVGLKPTALQHSFVRPIAYGLILELAG